LTCPSRLYKGLESIYGTEAIEVAPESPDMGGTRWEERTRGDFASRRKEQVHV